MESLLYFDFTVAAGGVCPVVRGVIADGSYDLVDAPFIAAVKRSFGFAQGKLLPLGRPRKDDFVLGAALRSPTEAGLTAYHPRLAPAPPLEPPLKPPKLEPPDPPRKPPPEAYQPVDWPLDERDS